MAFTMMSIPQLLDGLNRERIEVVQKAIFLHKKSFRSEFIQSILGSNAVPIEEHTNKMAIFLESILNRAKNRKRNSLFVQGLIRCTLDHLQFLLKMLSDTECKSSFQQQKKAVQELLLFHIKELNIVWTKIHEDSNTTDPNLNKTHEEKAKSPIKNVGLCTDASPSSFNKRFFDRWSSMIDKEVVRDALLDRDAVAHAREVLILRGERTPDTIDGFIKSIAYNYIAELLLKKQIDTAKDILWSIGRDVWPALKEICLDTVNVEIRNFLAFELKSLGLLSDCELEVWRYLILVEGVVRNCKLKVALDGEKLTILKGCESEIILDKKQEMDSEKQYEINISMSQLLALTPKSDTKDEFLIELFLKTQDRTLEPMLKKESCWKFLLLSNRLYELNFWANATMNSTDKHLESNNILDSVFSTWNITQEMVDFVKEANCHNFTKERLLDHLSRYDVYTTEESANLKQLLLREARNGQLSKHLKDKVKNLLVEFSLECNYPEILFSGKIAVEKGLSPWTDLYSEYLRCLEMEGCVPLLRCIIQSAQFFNLNSSTDLWVPLTYVILNCKQLSDALQCDHLTTDIPNFCVSANDLHMSLKLHPRLKSLLHINSDDKTLEDITILQLLEDCCPFSIQHEQSFCSLFQDGIDSRIYHFSDPSLVSLFGCSETLDYQYYLKQCRPCFASSVILADQVLSFGGPSRKLLKKACMAAHALAVSHFANEKVTASCVAFIEMLGGASTVLRCHLAAANFIFSSETTHDNALESHSKIVLLLKGLSSDDHAETALPMLQLLQKHLKPDILLHGLVVQLADIHQLQYPSSFLLHCSREDKWLEFLLFCHLFNTPWATAKIASKEFKSMALRKHFQLFLTRIQSILKLPPSSAPVESLSDQSSYKVLKGSGSFKVIPLCAVEEGPYHTDYLDGNFVEKISLMEDLFEVLWVCHQAVNPCAALLSACLHLPCPVLAVIADCYKPNPLLHLCVWLTSWFPLTESANKLLLKKNQPTVEDVEYIIFKSIEGGFHNLYTALNIFFPEHPLVHIVKGCGKFSNKGPMFNNCKWLSEFHNACQLTCSKIEVPFINDGSYILSLGYSILYNALELSFLSVTDKHALLRSLCEYPYLLQEKRKSTCVKLLCEVMNILSASEVQIDIKSYFCDPTNAIHHCISNLVHLKEFKLAENLASTAGIERSFIVVAKETDNFFSWLSTPCQDFKYFCFSCNNTFEDANVDPAAAFKFFDMCVNHLISHLDRWRALRSCYRWLSLCNPINEDLNIQLKKLEIQIWECCMNLDQSTFASFLDVDLKPTPLSFFCSEELGIDEQLNSESSSLRHSSIQSDRYTCAADLINHLLDIGDLASACSVKRLFGVDTMDLKTLEICIKLAEGKLDSYEVLNACNVVSSMKLSDYNSGIDQPDEKGNETIPSCVKKQEKLLSTSHTLNELYKQLKHGKNVAKQLLACYRLSCCLNLSYKEVSCVSDPLKLLRTALSGDELNYHSVASDVMTALNLTPLKCAEFLSREIIAAVSKGCLQGSVRDCTMWGYSLENHFSRLLELVPDPWLLGNELITFATKSSDLNKKPTKEVLIITVELLIRAHDSYSAGCHMEGIVSVLRSVSKLVLVLKARTQWALMVRLLTGIQRYTEMSYIFKILKENDQFEYLLRKDSVKPAGFKAALIEWLRKQCPDDPSLLKMTAAHFKMHKEEAAMWEAEGKKHMKDMVEIGLQINQYTQQILQTSLQDFSHAAECYLQADMLNHAISCAHQAELIALQIHLVLSSTGKQPLCILLLDSRNVARLITTSLSFHQAQIVGRAYNHPIDWGAALFYHCVSPGERAKEYFSAWSIAMELTPALVQDLAFRFQRLPAATCEMAANMCTILSRLQDMDVRYRIASELGFKDFVEDLLKAPEVAYLKDTVWQCGFKTSQK